MYLCMDKFTFQYGHISSKKLLSMMVTVIVLVLYGLRLIASAIAKIFESFESTCGFEKITD